MEIPKITADLYNQLLNASGVKSVEVIVELNQKPTTIGRNAESRLQKINKLKAHFQTGVNKVSDLLSKNGGKVIDGAWINQTIRVEVPVAALGTLSNLKEVSAIDTPRQLTSDFSG